MNPTISDDSLCTVFGFVPLLHTNVPLVCVRWARVLGRMGASLVACRKVFPTEELPGDRLSLYRYLGYVQPRPNLDARIPTGCLDLSRGDTVRLSPFGTPSVPRARAIRLMCADFAKQNAVRGVVARAEPPSKRRRTEDEPVVRLGAVKEPAPAPEAALRVAVKTVACFFGGATYMAGAWCERGPRPNEVAVLGGRTLLALVPGNYLLVAAVDVRTAAPFHGGCFDRGLYVHDVYPRPDAWLMCQVSATCAAVYARWCGEGTFRPAFLFTLTAEKGLMATSVTNEHSRTCERSTLPWAVPPYDADPADSDTVLSVTIG